MLLLQICIKYLFRYVFNVHVGLSDFVYELLKNGWWEVLLYVSSLPRFYVISFPFYSYTDRAKQNSIIIYTITLSIETRPLYLRDSLNCFTILLNLHTYLLRALACIRIWHVYSCSLQGQPTLSVRAWSNATPTLPPTFHLSEHGEPSQI